MVHSQMTPQPMPMGMPPHQQQPRPSALGYLVAAVVLLGGLGLAGYLCIKPIDRIKSFGDEFGAHVGPGTFTVDVNEPGQQKIYAESRSEVDGKVINSSTASFAITVTDPDGAGVQLEKPKASETYDINGRQGELIYTFDADQAGDYTVTTTSKQAGEEFVLAVGHLPVGEIVIGFVKAAGAAAVGLIGGFGIWLYTLLRRRRRPTQIL